MKKFSSITVAFLVPAICIFIFTRCSREYSYEGGNLPTTTTTITNPPAAIASFSINGSPNNCIDATVSGSYIAGVKLTVANTITVEVNVISVGAYTIQTDTLDGISFSATGAFTSTGNHTVTLVGNGTPSEPRNLRFTPAATTSSCTISVTVQNPEPLATYVLESGGSNPSQCIYSLTGSYIANTPLSNSNGISMRVYVTELGNFTIATDTNDGITFSYSGTFTAKGSQFVVLKGTGTPAKSGTYSLIPQIVGPHPLGGQSCAISIVVE